MRGDVSGRPDVHRNTLRFPAAGLSMINERESPALILLFIPRSGDARNMTIMGKTDTAEITGEID